MRSRLAATVPMPWRAKVVSMLWSAMLAVLATLKLSRTPSSFLCDASRTSRITSAHRSFCTCVAWCLCRSGIQHMWNPWGSYWCSPCRRKGVASILWLHGKWWWRRGDGTECQGLVILTCCDSLEFKRWMNNLQKSTNMSEMDGDGDILHKILKKTHERYTVYSILVLVSVDHCRSYWPMVSPAWRLDVWTPAGRWLWRSWNSSKRRGTGARSTARAWRHGSWVAALVDEQREKNSKYQSCSIVPCCSTFLNKNVQEPKNIQE